MSVLAAVLGVTKPVPGVRKRRMPLFLWPIMDIGFSCDGEARDAIRELAARGIALLSTWDPERFEESVERGLRAARIQTSLGLMVCVNATPALHRFCNGEEATAHISDSGERFFDFSFDPSLPLGCPFALQYRNVPMRDRVERFARIYARRRLPVDFVFADWEIDGPIEWNGAWEASRQCLRCRAQIPDIGVFASFQQALRTIRSEMQRVALADPLRSLFPGVLVGNYGVYPHDGYRYWYDYYERFVEGAPYKAEGGARYRQWYAEFPLTGYTMAMPVIYPWAPAYGWYDSPNHDFRWFRFLLLSVTNAGKSAPAGLPIVSFVHWQVIDVTSGGSHAIAPLSPWAYRELLWHALLRGHRSFFVWCAPNEARTEVEPVHAVYAASFEHEGFLQHGRPVLFGTPAQEGPVISGLRWGRRLLLRRTDFTDDARPVTAELEGGEVRVPRVEGRCQLLDVP